MSASIDVRGGPGGIVADCDDMVRTARLFASAAVVAAETSLHLHVALIDPELIGSSVVDPAGAARFAATLLSTLDGPGGLSVLAAECAATDASLRAAAASYVAADQLRTDLGPVVAAVAGLPTATARLAAAELHGHWSGGLDEFLTSDPQLVDLVAGQLQRLVPPTATLYADGRPLVVRVGNGPSAQPPRNLAAIMGSLAALNDDRVDGDIDVTILSDGDTRHAGRKVIVDIPGTGDWDVARLGDPDVTNMGTTLRALAGEPTTYEAGVLAALRAAGVRPSDDVMLVGHSQGGVVAVNAARDALASGEFTITHVITAGAPIGGVVGRLPPSVQVLALENDGDLVPATDGRPNPDRPNVTTVTVHHYQGDILDDHDLDRSYVPGAADIDASENASVRAYLHGLDGFLSADSATTQRFLVTRMTG